MCTVSFIGRKCGYLLGMNRDEQLTRVKGLAPRLRAVNGIKVICPSEPGGGTWIALNESGVTLALINWYAIEARVRGNAVSRGEIVRRASSARSPGGAQAVLDRLPLQRINPFRLIGVFPVTQELVEWQWDLRRLLRKVYTWKTQQWISSGFDEPEAQRKRSRSFRLARSQTTFGRATWLRRLHGSHAPKRGPFSTCMHRIDAATVSYTEVSVGRRRGVMLYHAGAPCLGLFARAKDRARRKLRIATVMR